MFNKCLNWSKKEVDVVNRQMTYVDIEVKNTVNIILTSFEFEAGVSLENVVSDLKTKGFEGRLVDENGSQVFTERLAPGFYYLQLNYFSELKMRVMGPESAKVAIAQCDADIAIYKAEAEKYRAESAKFEAETAKFDAETAKAKAEIAAIDLESKKKKRSVLTKANDDLMMDKTDASSAIKNVKVQFEDEALTVNPVSDEESEIGEMRAEQLEDENDEGRVKYLQDENDEERVKHLEDKLQCVSSFSALSTLSSNRTDTDTNECTVVKDNSNFEDSVSVIKTDQINKNDIDGVELSMTNR